MLYTKRHYPILDPDSNCRTLFMVVRCRGCREAAIRNEFWFLNRESTSGTPPTLDYVFFEPPRLWRRSPEWLDRLATVDPDLYDLLEEIYLAMNDNQFRLLAMGVRTALDHVMTKIVGDVGDFATKMREMVKAGHLSQMQLEMLETVIDAGSAAAHRGFKPPRPLLEEMVNIMEAIIRDHYLTGPLLKGMKAIVPPRPPRVKVVRYPT